MAALSQSISDYLEKISEYHCSETQKASNTITSEATSSSEGGNGLCKTFSWIYGMIKDAGSAVCRVVCLQGSAESAKLDEEKAEIEKLQADMEALKQSNPDLHKKVNEIINQHMAQLEEKASRSRNVTWLSGTGLLAIAAAVVAGIYVINWLITAVMIVGLGIAAFSIYNYIKNPDKPGDIKNLIDGVKDKFNHLQV
jgi:hypothetical protein